MGSCAAYGCTNRASRKRAGLTFHRFPKRPDIRAQWILAVRRKDWQPSKYSHLCSNHFTPNQFDRTSQSVVRLKEGAVPCVFKGYPSYIQKKPKAKKTFPCRMSVTDNSVPEIAEDIYSSHASASVTDASNLSIGISTLIEQLDHSVLTQLFSRCDTSQTALQQTENELLKKKLDNALELKQRYKEKIKCLQKSISYQKQKMKNLKQVLTLLKKERFRNINTSEILSTIIN